MANPRPGQPLFHLAWVLAFTLLPGVAGLRAADNQSESERGDAAEGKQSEAGKGDSEGGEPESENAEPGTVRVGKLVYDQGMSGLCFSDGFLAEVQRRSKIRVDREFHDVKLVSDELFNYPFLVMTGSEGFSLSKTERANLKRYVQRGGFILASSGCSNARWAEAFRSMVGKVFADESLSVLKLSHPIFNQVFEIRAIKMRRRGGEKAIQGLSVNGRLAIIFSPMGLNDSSNAGEGCCCCGGNELLNAKALNTNILVYALTH